MSTESLCGATSWTGRICGEPSHAGPVHVSNDGTRWRGDASAKSNGAGELPEPVRAAFLAYAEASAAGRWEEGHEAISVLLNALADACGVTWVDRNFDLSAALTKLRELGEDRAWLPFVEAALPDVVGSHDLWLVLVAAGIPIDIIDQVADTGQHIEVNP